MDTPTRILFVDDHMLFRESVARLIEQEPDLQVVSHCATLLEARRALIAMQVDLVLLDYDLGLEVGINLLESLILIENKTPVLLVTGGITSAATLKAMEAGVGGLVLKHSDPRQLIEAIRKVAAGETWWDAALQLTRGDAAARSAPPPSRSLSERQRQILHLILDGMTNKEVAARIQISETAVKASIQELFLKAGVRTRSQLVRIAIEKHASDWLGIA